MVGFFSDMMRRMSFSLRLATKSFTGSRKVSVLPSWVTLIWKQSFDFFNICVLFELSVLPSIVHSVQGESMRDFTLLAKGRGLL